MVADESLCVLGDVFDPYTRHGVLVTRYGHCAFFNSKCILAYFA